MNAAIANQLINAINEVKDALVESQRIPSQPSSEEKSKFEDKFNRLSDALEAVYLTPPQPEGEQG